MATKRGMGDRGRGKIRQNWQDIESGTVKPSWLTGAPSEQNQKLKEEIDESNAEYTKSFDTQTVLSIPEPDYYHGPNKSTRVIRHRFVPNSRNTAVGGLGTAYIQFGGTRKNGTKKTEDIYAYYNVPASVYLNFCNTNSKGQAINAWTSNYPDYEKIDDPSVF